MTALIILRAALRNIVADLPQMLRIFALPGLLMIACFAAVLMWLPSLNQGVAQHLVLTVAIVILLFCSVWGVVNFQRRVLLAEQFSWLPRPHGRAMLSYAIGATMAGAVMMATASVSNSTATFLLKFVPATNGTVASVLLLVLIYSVATFTVGLRLFSLLPALAINAPLRGYCRSGGLVTILWIALVFALADVSIVGSQFKMLPYIYMPEPNGPRAALRVIKVSARLLSVFLGLSVATVLYARFVQGRPV